MDREYIQRYVTDMRRSLHRIPELSEQEHRTGEFIARQIKDMGLSYTRIHTGLYVDVDGEDKGRRIAFRCDMDGLPITEKTNLEFRAEENMHACGHDGHMAIVLGLAKLLSVSVPRVSVRLIFQFGEEGDGGAAKMIEGGVLNGVDEIYAFHLCPWLDKGKIASKEGALFAGTVEFDVSVSGRASHCAEREKGCDALSSVFALAAAKRRTERENGVLFHIGKVCGGSARNIVSDSASAQCTLRYFDKGDAARAMDEVRAVLQKADAEFGTRSSVDVRTVYPPLLNSAYALGRLKSAVKVYSCKPRYTAEDFAFYTERTDGCMAWLGVKDEKHFSPLHSDTFDFDESALMLGVETMFALAGGKI